jgi:thioredoxin-like negative regulator of GroEL
MDAGVARIPDMKDMLAKLVKETYQIPPMIREIMEGRMELEIKLKLSVDEEKEMIQNNLARTDRGLEYLRSRQTANVATINLLASLIGTGKPDEALEVLTAMEKDDHKSSQAKIESNDSELNIDKIKVIEAKETKNPGTVRAWCQFGTGNKKAVFAKNSTGKTLLESVGKELVIKHRAMDKNTVFAVLVQDGV